MGDAPWRGRRAIPSHESRRRGLGRFGRLHPIASLRGVAVLLLAAGGCVTRLAVSALGYDTAPYVGDTTTTTSTISWLTKEPSIGRVEFGAYPGDLDQVRVELDARKIHEIPLDGLVPDTRYRYRVAPSGREDASGAFWTAPSAADSFSFVVLGDTRGHEIHRSIVRQILQLDPAPRFVFNLGDMVGNGESAPEWQAFFEDVAPLARFVPYYSTLGNHEHDAEVYFELFALPQNSPLPERSYSFDWGNSHFTVIDASKKHRDDERQLQWLAQDLERARSATFRIAFFHHSGHGTRPARGEDHERVSRLLDPYLERGHVDLVFNGHDHSYVRASRNGVDYIVTGGGGAILNNLGPPSGDTIVQYKVHHFCRVRVSADQLEVVAIDASGTRIDSLVRKAMPASYDHAGIGE